MQLDLILSLAALIMDTVYYFEIENIPSNLEHKFKLLLMENLSNIQIFYSGQVEKSSILTTKGANRIFAVRLYLWVARLIFNLPSIELSNHFINLERFKHSLF